MKKEKKTTVQRPKRKIIMTEVEENTPTQMSEAPRPDAPNDR